MPASANNNLDFIHHSTWSVVTVLSHEKDLVLVRMRSASEGSIRGKGGAGRDWTRMLHNSLLDANLYHCFRDHSC